MERPRAGNVPAVATGYTGRAARRLIAGGTPMFRHFPARAFPLFALAAALAVVAGAPRAEVVDASRNGFTTRASVVIEAPRAAVYRAATGRLPAWWIDDHTVSGNASNLTLDAVPQGCLCENLGQGGGVVHLTVTFVSPGTMLRLTGALGPLGLLGTSGNLVWEFEDAGQATRVTWTYVVGGYAPGGLEKMAAAVDGMLAAQLASLKAFVEKDHPG
ncbi:MAG TPA: SRPBCC family protein [Woeseiaceae bacterium]